MAKKITVNQPFLSRVEGHGGITVGFRNGEVSEARVQIFEGSRYFEKIATGRYVEQVPELVCRICSICSASHKIVSIQALEDALGIEISEDTRDLRKLLHFGGLLESHALHLFLLALPDYEGVPSALHLLPRMEREYHQGMELKHLGNRIQEIVGGHTIHMPEPVLGGFGSSPKAEDFNEILHGIDGGIEAANRAMDLLGGDQPEIPLDEVVSFLAASNEEEYAYMGRELVLVRDGKREEIPLGNYFDRLHEKVVPWSRAKQCSVDRRSFMVGALARVTANSRQLSRDALGSLQSVRGLIEKRNALSNNLAQAVETVDLLNRVRELCLSLLERYPLDLRPKTRITESGEGFGLVEAPRGSLIHHYRVENGKVVWANILTPTALNLASMEERVLYTAKALAGKDPNEIRPLLEIIPRAYDPCISCSVH